MTPIVPGTRHAMEGWCGDDPRTPLRRPTEEAEATPRRPALEHTTSLHVTA
jgi:hypothetical protein